MFTISEDMRTFLKQIRLETGIRVCAKVYENSDKPSKVFKLSDYLKKMTF